MIAKGVLTESDPVELLEVLLVSKTPHSLAHDFAITALEKRLHQIVPDPFVVRGQCAATFADSEPEPDFIVARGPESEYRKRHPGPAERCSSWKYPHLRWNATARTRAADTPAAASRIIGS